MRYYIGLSLASTSGMDSGLAIFDENRNLIMVDKLYKMSDIIHFFDNYSSTGDSELCVSLAWDRTMLNGKWRILSKPYQMVSTNKLIPNQDNWTQRFTTRGSDYFKSLTERGANVNRFEIYLTRQSLHLNSCFKERSPADCKFLQQTLTNEWGIELPQNMMPMSQLEAITGALLAKENYENKQNIKTIASYRGLNVIDVISNPNPCAKENIEKVLIKC